MSTSSPGLSFAATIVESARQSLLQLLRNRMVLVLGAANIALAVLAIVVGRPAEERLGGRSLFCLIAWWLLATVLMPWSTLYLGVQAVHGPLEDRTFQYLFLRPVSRAALLLGKWIAVCAVAAVMAIGGVFLLFLAVASRPGLWPDGTEWRLALTFAEALGAGVVAYGAVAVLFGAWFRRPLVIAAIFVVGLQTLAANLDVSAGLRRLTVLDPMRRLVLDGVEPDSRLAQILWPAERDFRSEMIGTPMTDLAVLIAVCLVLALFAFCKTEYDSRDRE